MNRRDICCRYFMSLLQREDSGEPYEGEDVIDLQRVNCYLQNNLI